MKKNQYSPLTILCNLNFFLLIILLPLFTFASTVNLDAVSGTGAANEWNTGGTNVGTDCATEDDAIEANTNTKNKELSAPIANTALTGAITSVEVRVYARSSVDLTGTADGIRVALYNGATMYQDATTDEVTTTLAYYTNTWTLSPITSAAWTWAEVNTIDAGCQAIATGASSIDLLYVDHVRIVVTYNAIPVVTGLTAAANLDSDAAQQTDGSGQIIVDYEVSDADHATVTISLEYWNNITWGSATTTSGDIGAGIDATSSTTDRSITWEADTDLGAVEVSNYNVRVVATDAGTASSNAARSANDFIIDTQAPTGYACSTPANASGPSGPDVTLTSASASDISTISYYLEVDDNADCLSPFDNSGWQSEDNDWVAAGLTLGNTYYWRVKAKDSYGNEGTPSAIFSFTVDNSKPNVVIDNVTQATDGTGLVTVQYDLSDPQAPENCELLIEHSVGTWYQSFINSASVGTIDNTNVNTGTATRQIHTISTDQSNVTFVWASQNASNDNGALASEYANAYVRITPKDALANTGSTVSSISFVLDNADPTGYGCSTPADLATGISINVSLVSTTASDLSSIQYYFELATDAGFTANVQQSGWQAGSSWSPATLSYDTQYYWHVKARDSYGNEGAYAASRSFTSLDGWVYPSSGTIGACSAPALGDTVVYIGTGGTDDKVYCIGIRSGTLMWSYTADGDVNNVSCHYYSGSGKYAVYFTTASSSLYALWDDVNSSSDKWVTNPVAFGVAKATTEPIPDADGTNIYLGYNKYGYKYLASDGSEVWNTGTTISPSGTSAPMVDNTSVFFAAAANTFKYLVDGTASGNTGYGTNTPLGGWSGYLYIAAPDNFVYAINASTCALLWQSQDLGGQTYTGPSRGYAAESADKNKLYVGADDDLVKINTTNGNIIHSRTVAAGNTINSTPIVASDGSKIYFGCDNSKAYMVDSTSTLSDISGWPNTAGGPVQATPAVDETNNVAVFGSNEGKVYGFFLQ